MGTDRPAPVGVDIVSDVVCPWCVIGHLQLVRAAEETGIPVAVRWHPFELNPGMAPGGEHLGEHIAAKYGGTPEQGRAARARIRDLGAELGFAFAYAEDSRIHGTFLAHQLIRHAGTEGRAHAAKTALFEAYFARGLPVDDLDVLAGVAVEIGLDADAARRSLEAGEHAEAVRAEEAYWTSAGITGVPAMVFEGKYLVSGAQGVAAYASVLRHLRPDGPEDP